MMLILGTIPNKDMPLTTGQVSLEGEFLVANGRRFACTQGTGALITAALITTSYLKVAPPHVLVVGDVGGISDKGTRELYQYLIDNVGGLLPEVLVLHYCLPIMPLMEKLCQAIDKCSRRPFMIADAGAMYAAKGAGLAGKFDIFTPDVTEMGFLADPEAAHPAYAARHLFDCEPEKIPELIAAAYKDKNAAKLLVVKGKIDHIAGDGKVLAKVDAPDIPELEAIGGTGDTITGIVSALVFAGYKPHEAAIVAAKANRMAGKFARATPATKVKQIIDQFPAVFKEYLSQWTEGAGD
ncbi:MAG: NAD(P)H-hydrate dehydratase [Dehalococcoidales bacterium]|nr:NAD(P)H-hydrate dehydratase [Dehalococcoidales bacterium]